MLLWFNGASPENTEYMKEEGTNMLLSTRPSSSLSDDPRLAYEGIVADIFEFVSAIDPIDLDELIGQRTLHIEDPNLVRPLRERYGEDHPLVGWVRRMFITKPAQLKHHPSRFFLTKQGWFRVKATSQSYVLLPLTREGMVDAFQVEGDPTIPLQIYEALLGLYDTTLQPQRQLLANKEAVLKDHLARLEAGRQA